MCADFKPSRSPTLRSPRPFHFFRLAFYVCPGERFESFEEQLTELVEVSEWGMSISQPTAQSNCSGNCVPIEVYIQHDEYPSCACSKFQVVFAPFSIFKIKSN